MVFSPQINCTLFFYAKGKGKRASTEPHMSLLLRATDVFPDGLLLNIQATQNKPQVLRLIESQSLIVTIHTFQLLSVDLLLQ